MGCVGSKPSAVKDDGMSPRNRAPSKRLSRSVSSSREGDTQMMMNRSDSSSLLIDRQESGSIRLVNLEDSLVNHPVIGSLPKTREGEQVAAGWPSWLVQVAGAALGGWIPRRADTFEKLCKIGEGTYSSVYKARDLINSKTVALKRVRFDKMDTESVKFMSREILILRKLNHPNIIKLEGLITSSTSSSLYLIFEYMEHDLTGLTSLPGVKFSEPQVKCYMQQLLTGLEHCHSHGVLHRDIKSSNLLIDSSGILKIADFGLATFFDPHKSLPLTSRVVTLWYRPPELLLGATHYGTSVDLWSAGCILGELYAGKPIMPGRTEVEQLHKIFKLCGSPSEEYWEKSKLPHSSTFKPQKRYPKRITERFQDVSGPALDLMETLLSVDPAARGTATAALKSEFFTTKPFACDPFSLPKYPPSKEIDARRREEEARRRQASEDKVDKVDQGKKGLQESTATLSAKVNAEFVSSLQKKHGHSQSKPQTQHESSSSCEAESTSSPVFDSTRNSQPVKEISKEKFDHVHQRGMYLGSQAHGAGWSNVGRKLNDPPSYSRAPNLSSLVPNRSSMAEDSHGNIRSSLSRKGADTVGNFPESRNDLEGERKKDWLDYSGSFVNSRQFEETNSGRRPSWQNYAPDDERLHLSGPLLHPSKDLDQMLKEHDRRIQESDRRTRLDKFRPRKVLAR